MKNQTNYYAGFPMWINKDKSITGPFCKGLQTCFVLNGSKKEKNHPDFFINLFDENGSVFEFASLWKTTNENILSGRIYGNGNNRVLFVKNNGKVGSKAPNYSIKIMGQEIKGDHSGVKKSKENADDIPF